MSDAQTPATPYPPYAGIYITGKAADPQEIRELLGISPSSGFARGDRRPRDDGKRSHGLWTLDSLTHVTSLDPVVHLRWLVSELRPVRSRIRDLSENSTIQMVMTLFWVLPSSDETLELDTALMQQIAAPNIDVKFSKYAPDE
jgi:hypothetical protein